MRMTVAKEILQTSREMFPVDMAYTDDQLWEMLQIGSFIVCQCYSTNRVGPFTSIAQGRKGVMGEFSDEV